jgi:cell wall-associated NlpC family hydrolase
MDYAIVAVPAAPVRRKANHRSEMVNQLLFGESVKVGKGKKDLWVKVRSFHDGYEGWMTHSMLSPVEEAVARMPVTYVTTGILSRININGRRMHIPAGSTLPGFTESGNGGGTGAWHETRYEYEGSFLRRQKGIATPEMVRELALPWLNVPYLWGGRTTLGVDCSGFTQVIFRQMGIDLPRDAWQQAQVGTPVKKFSQAQPGDLVFFDNREDIVHVGILLAPGEMIHASGKVKMDMLSKKGIINADARGSSIRLRAIRRMW